MSVATIDVIGADAHAAASQLVDLRFLEVMAEYVGEHVTPVAQQISADPAAFAYEDVWQLTHQTTELAHKAESIGSNPLPDNQDRAGALAGHLAAIRIAHATANAALEAVAGFGESHKVGNTFGETYEDTEADLAENTHWSVSGVGHGALYELTSFSHFVGNLVTGSHLNRQASNARAYQQGRISYNAWKENEGWNMATSLVTAAVETLTAGVGSYAAAGGGLGTDMAIGGMSGAAGAMTSDAMAGIAAGVTSDRYVREYQTQSAAGPLGWLLAGVGGAAAGGLLGRMLRGGKSTAAGDEESGLTEQLTGNQGETPPVGEVNGNAEPVAMLNGKPIKPSHYGTVYHGNDMPPQEVLTNGGLPAGGTNWDLANHSESISGNSAFRGATTMPITPDGKQGAAHWGRYVYKIRGMPAWDLNEVMQGRVDTGLGYRGPLMHGELEHAIPARVPIENIEQYGEVVEGPRGRLHVEWHSLAELAA